MHEIEYCGVNKCMCIDLISKPFISVPAFKHELSSAVPMGFLLKIRK